MAQEQIPKRLQLHELLETFADHVYFQAPSNDLMEYPCIKYEQNDADTLFAGNLPYRYTKRYQVMVIDRDPDSPIADKIAFLPMCTFATHYTADDLHHYVFNLFF
jgi:hypothetical protein